MVTCFIRATTTAKKISEGDALKSEINIQATTIHKKKAEGDGLMSEIDIRATKECASTAGRPRKKTKNDYVKILLRHPECPASNLKKMSLLKRICG
jgi:hypothetical protein